MKQPLVSVIVPVFNSEKFIKRCLDSLVQQTYSNIEIIVINDGSTDNSFNILRGYKDKYYKKIRLISQDNKGSGQARQTGINHVSGDYFTFVDSDDELKPNAISDLINDLKGNTDIIISGFISKAKDRNKIIKHVPKVGSIWSELKYPCTAFKLYKKAYIKDIAITYPSFFLLEDVSFNVVAFSKTNNIVIQEKMNYINHLRDNSITASINTKYTIENILDYISRNVNENKFPKDMLTFFYEKTALQNILINSKILSCNELNTVYTKYYKWLKSNRGKLIIWQNGEDFKINILCLFFMIFSKIKLRIFPLLSIKLLKLGS